jgi:hypothetical protein
MIKIEEETSTKEILRIFKITKLVEEEIKFGLVKKEDEENRVLAYIKYKFLEKEEQKKLWYKKKYFKNLDYKAYLTLKELRFKLLSI